MVIIIIIIIIIHKFYIALYMELKDALQTKETNKQTYSDDLFLAID